VTAVTCDSRRCFRAERSLRLHVTQGHSGPGRLLYGTRRASITLRRDRPRLQRRQQTRRLLAIRNSTDTSIAAMHRAGPVDSCGTPHRKIPLVPRLDSSFLVTDGSHPLASISAWSEPRA
jgi:hypothetical protein